MKCALFDTKTNSFHVFSCKTDLAAFIGVTTKTVNKWQRLNPFKERNGMRISFDVTMHKASQKARTGFK